ncbi:MAG TPA: AIR synthase-related protein [Candidatus Andersenbacteria bacterium]|nr:AIR synthase-related protein [Candidatus Andersenbacteria bacterium]
MTSSAYAASGVDMNAKAEFVDLIRQRIAAAWPGAGEEIGGFAGTISLSKPTAEITGCTDGTGTMVILAALTERLEVAGNNAAGMSLMDAYAESAHPVGLLDNLYFAKLIPEKHIAIIDGLIAACRRADTCRLIGGETEQLLDMFRQPWMVLVNTAVVAVPDSAIITKQVEAGQIVWGWRSNGLGSNGFSLARRVLHLNERLSRVMPRLNRHVPALGKTLADALLEPAPIWIKQIETQRLNGVRFAAHAHITGGGLVDNIPRVLPANCKVILDRSSWQRPPIFSLIQHTGGIDPQEMDRVFNQGLMVVSILDRSSRDPDTPNMQPIGTVEKRSADEPQVQFISQFN